MGEIAKVPEDSSQVIKKLVFGVYAFKSSSYTSALKSWSSEALSSEIVLSIVRVLVYPTSAWNSDIGRFTSEGGLLISVTLRLKLSSSSKGETPPPVLSLSWIL